MLGAQVDVVVSANNVLRRRVRTDGSYLTANDPRVLVGIGSATRVQSVRVCWPDGTVEEFRAPAINKYTTLESNK